MGQRLLCCVLAPVVALLASPGVVAHAQGFGCLPDPGQNRVEMGSIDAQGVTQTAALGSPTDSVGFHFMVPQPSATLLYVGDQWFDIDLYLYARGQCSAGSWDRLIRSWSTRAERRVVQFMRPDEQIVNLAAGEYLMVAEYKPPSDAGAADPFDPNRPFTARVALNTPYCGLAPADVMVPNPALPSIMLPKRPDDALYQLGLSIDPAEKDRVPFSLMTFAAFVSPPYTDLFDFDWVLDGQPVPDVNIATFQVPTDGLPRAADGQHTIQVTALGVRQYPDPSLTHIPPTLSVRCSFKVPT